MITVKPSPTADTRTCDVSTVDKATLLDSSKEHIYDVRRGMQFFETMIYNAGVDHDHTKISHIDSFFEDFKTKFEIQNWYDLHKRTERHHLNAPEGVRPDVNLVDVLEFIVDGVMAGVARSGKAYPPSISSDVLIKAFENTVTMIMNEVELEK